MNEPKKELTFGKLVNSIRQIHDQMAAQAGKAVNISLTLRNWAIGFYIQEYEQNGADRAKYGTRLLEKLSSQLVETGIDGVAARSLRQYRQFYLTYPRIWQTPSANSLSDSNADGSQAVPTVPVQFGIPAALAGMDNALFVSRYQVELPKKEDMQRFIEETIKEVGDLKSS